jgi:hypothetical protein
MLDFAASMLAELERFMLTAGPAMIDLNTFCDTSDKLMSSVSVVEEVQRRLYTDEVRPVNGTCMTLLFLLPAKR